MSFALVIGCAWVNVSMAQKDYAKNAHLYADSRLVTRCYAEMLSLALEAFLEAQAIPSSQSVQTKPKSSLGEH